jgi:hypothetical protein
MYYLSFDVANKSLATSFIFYDLSPEYIQNFNNIRLKNTHPEKEQSNNFVITTYDQNLQLTCNNMIKLNTIINNKIEYLYYDVKDLIPGKKVKDTDIIERSKNLKKYMEELKLIVNKTILEKNINKIYILIEYQLSSNYNANAIYNQIIYEFSEPNTNLYEITIMNPSYKNKIYFKKELRHSFFIQKYSNNYIANKNHTKSNFLYFLKLFNLNHVLENIKSKNIDDLADSFMQIFAFIKFIQK